MRPFPKEGAPPVYLDQIRSLFRRDPQATIIWAHTAVGRIVHPVNHHAPTLEAMIKDHAFVNIYFDISWDQVAKHFVFESGRIEIGADLINRYPTDFSLAPTR